MTGEIVMSRDLAEPQEGETQDAFRMCGRPERDRRISARTSWCAGSSSAAEGPFPSAAILNRNPPSPIALVAMVDTAGRKRLVQLLKAVNIEFVEAAEADRAAGLLELTMHAVLFTDQIEIIRGARGLPVGAATHLVFVNNPGRSVSSEAWRAGAHDCMPAEFGGEEFWAHLTTARRIIGLAGSLNLALADNRILSTVDALTRCGSRRFFEKEFPREVERAIRLDRPLSLVMCDIDYFNASTTIMGTRSAMTY